MARFENYKKKKGFWFWMMLTLGAAISDEPRLSVLKDSDNLLVTEFMDSTFYKSFYGEDNTGKGRYLI